MGQLERYGLYVLVLVIFLILGVAMWGEPPKSTRPGEGNPMAARAEPARDPIARALQEGAFDVDDVTEVAPANAPARPAAEPVVPADDPGGDDVVTEPPASPVVALRTYRIRENDVLVEIAKRELGSASYWPRIKEVNPGLDETKLPIGKEIKLPNIDGGGGEGQKAAAGRSYVVQKGDSPARISKRFFGTESRAEDIMRVNGIADARKLMPGTTIAIPQ